MKEKYYCPTGCVHGDIIKCDVDGKFSETTVFTDEPDYNQCPRYFEKEKLEANDEI